jgi:hypothetical protein
MQLDAGEVVCVITGLQIGFREYEAVHKLRQGNGVGAGGEGLEKLQILTEKVGRIFFLHVLCNS